MEQREVKPWLKYGVIWLIIGIIASFISVSLAHICQIITRNSQNCRYFAYPFHLFVDLSKIPSERIGFGLGIIITLIIFTIIGMIIGLVKRKKKY